MGARAAGRRTPFPGSAQHSATAQRRHRGRDPVVAPRRDFPEPLAPRTSTKAQPRASCRASNSRNSLRARVRPKNTGAWSNSKDNRPRNGGWCQRISVPSVPAPARRSSSSRRWSYSCCSNSAVVVKLVNAALKLPLSPATSQRARNSSTRSSCASRSRTAARSRRPLTGSASLR